MGKLIKLNIITPGRETISEEVVSLNTAQIDGRIEILAQYAPSIIATIPTVSSFIMENGERKNIFTSNGILYIKKNEINFCCDSANFPDEIDVKRAEESRDRAIKRLGSKDDIDKERAEKSLARAKARLELK